MRIWPNGAWLSLAFVVAGGFGWAVFFVLFRNTFGQDWMVFDTAARAYWAGDTALMLDGVRLTRVLNATHPTLLQPLVFHPWVYPPYTLLLALPFGLVPWPLSYGGFQLLSFGVMALALRWWVRGWRRFCLALVVTALSPAAAYNLGAGQNGFLSAALLLAGIWLLSARPFAAGVVLGLLAYKPQLGLLLPVAFIACGAWRAMAGAAATVALLVAISLAVPGLLIWHGWLHLFLSGSDAPRQWVELYGQSVFTYLRLAGVPAQAANAGQAAALIVSAGLVWLVFKTTGSAVQRLLVLLTAISFSAPHFGDYDAVLLAVVAALVLLGAGAPRHGGAVWLACLAWCSTAINPPLLYEKTIPPLFALSECTPLLLLALLAKLAADAMLPQRPYDKVPELQVP
jgi:hypothetical protein